MRNLNFNFAEENSALESFGSTGDEYEALSDYVAMLEHTKVRSSSGRRSVSERRLPRSMVALLLNADHFSAKSGKRRRQMRAKVDLAREVSARGRKPKLSKIKSPKKFLIGLIKDFVVDFIMGRLERERELIEEISERKGVEDRLKDEIDSLEEQIEEESDPEVIEELEAEKARKETVLASIQTGTDVLMEELEDIVLEREKEQRKEEQRQRDEKRRKKEEKRREEQRRQDAERKRWEEEKERRVKEWADRQEGKFIDGNEDRIRDASQIA